MKKEELKLLESSYISKTLKEFTKRDYEKHIKRLIINIDNFNDLFTNFYKTNFFNYAYFLHLVITDLNQKDIDLSPLSNFNDSVNILKLSFLNKSCIVRGILFFLRDFEGLKDLHLKINYSSFKILIEELQRLTAFTLETINIDLLCTFDEGKLILKDSSIIGNFLSVLYSLQEKGKCSINNININICVVQLISQEPFHENIDLLFMIENNYMKVINHLSMFCINTMIFENERSLIYLESFNSKIKSKNKIKRINNLLISSSFIIVVDENHHKEKAQKVIKKEENKDKK